MTLAEKQARCKSVVRLLKKNYPDSKCSLNFSNPFELLIATMLSAQCTDERVNKVTPQLFAKFPTPEKMAEAKQEEIENIIRSTGFFRNKAKGILQSSITIRDQYKGAVPTSMKELSALPGVGRKTANVVLGNAFGIPGMVVDTHVTRLVNRLGFAKGENAVQLERDLEKVVEKKDWIVFSHLLISHGRAVCTARSPKCDSCFLVPGCFSVRKKTSALV